jgi:hypothetical protein
MHYHYGAILMGGAHLLSGLFRRLYIPSSWTHEQQSHHGTVSTALVNRLASTDSLEIIHHGASVRRVEKVAAIAGWDFAQHYLRVCPHTGLSDYQNNWLNCSRCEKCMRTMIPIYAVGHMAQFETFTKPLERNRDSLWWARKYSPYAGFTGEIIPFVKKHMPDLVPWLRIAAVVGIARYLSMKLIPSIVKKWLQRFGYFIDPFDIAGADENPDVLRIIRESSRQTT